ncbi:unnamed protein product, partial [marine sediment metagenome]
MPATTPSVPFTFLDHWRPTTVAAVVVGKNIRLSPADLSAATGWESKPEGFCR